LEPGQYGAVVVVPTGRSARGDGDFPDDVLLRADRHCRDQLRGYTGGRRRLGGGRGDQHSAGDETEQDKAGGGLLDREHETASLLRRKRPADGTERVGPDGVVRSGVARRYGRVAREVAPLADRRAKNRVISPMRPPPWCA